MGVLDRLNALVRSSINDVISRMQDPAKEVDLLIDEMAAAATRARADVVTCLAEQKRLETRHLGLRASGGEWGQRAERAVLAGDDALARDALAKQAEIDREASEIGTVLEEQRMLGKQLTDALATLEARLREVQMRRGTLKGAARRAAGQDPTSTSSKAFEDYANLERNVDAMEAESQLEEELLRDQGKDPETERRLRQLERNDGVEDALAALKRKLDG